MGSRREKKARGRVSSRSKAQPLSPPLFCGVSSAVDSPNPSGESLCLSFPLEKHLGGLWVLILDFLRVPTLPFSVSGVMSPSLQLAPE